MQAKFEWGAGFKVGVSGVKPVTKTILILLGAQKLLSLSAQGLMLQMESFYGGMNV